MADSREGGEAVRERKDPVFEKSMAYKIHRGEARGASQGKVAGRSGAHASGNGKKKKDAPSDSKDPWSARGNEDVDAVWHRGSRPRNF